MVISSVGVLDVSVGFTSDDGRWNAAVFVKNAQDDIYEVRRNQLVFDNGTSIAQGLAHDYRRYTGVSFTYNLGDY